MKNKSAKEYWKDRFGEYPQNDADRLAVAMMMEYYYDLTKGEVVKNNKEKEAFIAGYKYFRSISETGKKYEFDWSARAEAINQFHKWKEGNVA